ncbi:unnamed protein product [Peronospora destructor]|uniref:Chromo domain-containing protein n=1 Tax=Peronospora destructor TaxID=86335 RepID=A0AAV0TWF3_9STRA|nr:unnamed protein product [Peronospora destructor]
MDTFRIGDKVILSTNGLWDSAVTNSGASKLAPCFIGPFAILKTIGDAYTLDIPMPLRLHPTFYVGRLKRYNSAKIPEDAWRVESVAHRIDVPTSSSVRVTLDSTGVFQQQSSELEQHVPKPPQPSNGHRPPGSPLHSHRPGQPGRDPYRRDGPPPLVDSAGDVCWFVDHIVGHEDPPRASSAPPSSRISSARRYLARWLGFPPEEDSWEPRTSLLREIPDVVHDYESKKAAVKGTSGRRLGEREREQRLVERDCCRGEYRTERSGERVATRRADSSDDVVNESQHRHD